MKETRLVPDADFDSYYGRPILKGPVWKQPDVSLYFFLGGLAGASAVLAEGAALTGRPELQRVSRVLAAAGITAGIGALIHDLGRPARFLHMLRVLKPTSPMSVGSWVMAPFSGLATAALVSDVTGVLPRLGRTAGIGAAVLGPALSTYTAALIADTAIPTWHEGYRELPFVFAGGATAAAGGLAMVATPASERGPARRLGVMGGVVELAATERMRRRLGPLDEPYRQGRPGVLLRAARALTAGGVAAAVLSPRLPVLARPAGAALATGSLLTRFGLLLAGRPAAEDPRHVVVPQRARLTEPVGTLSG